MWEETPQWHRAAPQHHKVHTEIHKHTHCPASRERWGLFLQPAPAQWPHAVTQSVCRSGFSCSILKKQLCPLEKPGIIRKWNTVITFTRGFFQSGRSTHCQKPVFTPEPALIWHIPTAAPHTEQNSALSGDGAVCGTLISETTEPSNTLGTAPRLRGESKGLSPALFWFNPLQTAIHTLSKAGNCQGPFQSTVSCVTHKMASTVHSSVHRAKEDFFKFL